MTCVTIKILFWSWTFGKVSYDALSYFWGPRNATETIYLDDRPYLITATLYLALQSLRSTQASRLLWVDQICIDQGGNAIAERNCQVQRMGEIYKGADTVIVWLGKATRSSSIVFDAVSRVNDDAIELSNSDQEPDSIPERSIFNSIQGEAVKYLNRHMGDHEIRNVLATEMSNLLRNSWFSRIWVVQEAVLAKRLILRAGRQQVSWGRFVSCLRSLQSNTKIKAVDALPVFDIEMLRNDGFKIGGQATDILKLLIAFRGRQASDSRDKIFGLLGLISPRPSEVTFSADYSKSPEQIFMGFTLWHIKSKGCLDVLTNCCAEEEYRFVAKGSGEYEMPSWATDWSHRKVGEKSDLIQELGESVPVYHAFTGRQGPVQLLHGFEHGLRNPYAVLSVRNILSLTGLFIDTVAQSSDKVYTWADNDISSAIWPTYKAFARQERPLNPYTGQESILEVLWQVITSDNISRSERPSMTNGAAFTFLLAENNIDFKTASEHYSIRHHETSETMELPDVTRIKTQPKERIKGWKPFHNGRRIFLTGRGYLGISCQHIKQGDKICILRGGRLPFILREHARMVVVNDKGKRSFDNKNVVQSHKIIGGECYIHGLTNGEGLEAAKKESISLTKIYLT